MGWLSMKVQLGLYLLVSFVHSHPAWEFVDAKTKKALELIFRDDGEFWFPLNKLAVHFDFVEVCAV